jgi:kynurenine formamidase
MRFIDLSLPVKNNTSEPESPVIRYLDHAAGARHLINAAVRLSMKNNLIKGLTFWSLNILARIIDLKKIGKKLKINFPAITPGDFPSGMALANEEIRLDGHSGTHLDAPWHFGPMVNGRRSRTIDEVPLEWCYGNGVVLDLRYKKPGQFITCGDLQNALHKIRYRIRQRDIVLLMTGADRRFNEKDYFFSYPGMSSEATLFLLKKKVRIIGTDAWGFDRPAMNMLSDYLHTQDPSFLFPAHFAGRDMEYCHIEKLGNLDKIPKPFGFKVACFPVKIEKGSAGWCRVVAIL